MPAKAGISGASVTELVAGGPLRGGDEQGGMGTICLICTTRSSPGNRDVILLTWPECRESENYELNSASDMASMAVIPVTHLDGTKSMTSL
jgi:hypothetical protein